MLTASTVLTSLQVDNVNLIEKHEKCIQLIADFRKARKVFLDLSPTSRSYRVYTSVLLGLMSSIGEQVAYIRDYQVQVNLKLVYALEDYEFIIPVLRNLAYHHLSDTQRQRELLAQYRYVNISDISDIIVYILGTDFDDLLTQVVDFAPPTTSYTRNITKPKMNDRISPSERLKMAKKAAEEAIIIQEWLTKASDFSSGSAVTTSMGDAALRALDFQLTRMCVAYEDYEKELGYYKSGDPVKENHMKMLKISRETQTLLVLLNRIHNCKLALAHGSGGFSIETSRQMLLEKMPACKILFETLISGIENPHAQQPALVEDKLVHEAMALNAEGTKKDCDSPKTPASKKADENMKSPECYKALQERYAAEMLYKNQREQQAEKVSVVKQTNKRSPLSTITNLPARTAQSSNAYVWSAPNQRVVAAVSLESAKRAKRR